MSKSQNNLFQKAINEALKQSFETQPQKIMFKNPVMFTVEQP
jgi:high-affinity K+ transport system ATPase subunit B